MRLSTIVLPFLLATSSSAATFMSSMEAVTEVAERNYIGGPAAIARAMSAARHVGKGQHASMRTRHQAKMAQWQDRDSEYVNMKYREFLGTMAKDRATNKQKEDQAKAKAADKKPADKKPAVKGESQVKSQLKPKDHVEKAAPAKKAP